MAKKFKRYFTGKETNGKGSWQRDTQVDAKQAANNWCETFGHKPENHTGAFCTNCGKTLVEPAQIIDLMAVLKESLAKKK